MRKVTLASLVYGMCFLSLCVAAAAQTPATLVMDNEYGIRHRTTNEVKPEYPEEAIREGAQGWVIAAVQFDVTGKLVKAEVLESPHPLLKQAVLDALQGWKTKPITMSWGEVSRSQGELRFYFSITDGQGRVSPAPEAEQKKLSEPYKKMQQRFRAAP